MQLYIQLRYEALEIEVLQGETKYETRVVTEMCLAMTYYHFVAKNNIKGLKI